MPPSPLVGRAAAREERETWRDESRRSMSELDRIAAALDVAGRFGGIDGADHKAWVIDQMVRALHGDERAYQAWVRDVKAGEEGPDTYEWNEGIAP